MSRSKRTPHEFVNLPHSWDFTSWPPSVYPGNTRRAKYLFRVSQRELLVEGACARVGRSIVFFGEQYGKFLRKRAARVPDFVIAANRNTAERTAA